LYSILFIIKIYIKITNGKNNIINIINIKEIRNNTGYGIGICDMGI
jgi:hypothetical protein